MKRNLDRTTGPIALHGIPQAIPQNEAAEFARREFVAEPDRFLNRIERAHHPHDAEAISNDVIF